MTGLTGTASQGLESRVRSWARASSKVWGRQLWIEVTVAACQGTRLTRLTSSSDKSSSSLGYAARDRKSLDSRPRPSGALSNPARPRYLGSLVSSLVPIVFLDGGARLKHLEADHLRQAAGIGSAWGRVMQYRSSRDLVAYYNHSTRGERPVTSARLGPWS